MSNNLIGIKFENLCKLLLEQLGFIDIVTTKTSGDYGVDILCNYQDLRYAVQCKKLK